MTQLEEETRDPRGRAYHEAGHAVVAHMLGARPYRVEIFETGHGKTWVAGDVQLEIVDHLAICVAGERAEIMFNAPTPDAAKHEDRKAVVRLLRMVNTSGHETLCHRALGEAETKLRTNADDVHRVAQALIERSRIEDGDLLELLSAPFPKRGS